MQAHTTHARQPYTAESPNHKCIPATCTLLAPASGVQVSSAQHGDETSKQAQAATLFLGLLQVHRQFSHPNHFSEHVEFG